LATVGAKSVKGYVVLNVDDGFVAAEEKGEEEG
jgi:hypothetical protein